MDLTHRAHNTVRENLQSGTSRPNTGISTLSPLDGPQPRFLSGGFDMTVHLWTLRHTDDGFQAHSRRLRVRHLQGVQSLAYRSIDNTLLSCGGSSIYSTDISVDQQTKPVKVTDGRLLQIHVHPQNPQVVVLEVSRGGRRRTGGSWFSLQTGRSDREPGACIRYAQGWLSPPTYSSVWTPEQSKR